MKAAVRQCSSKLGIALTLHFISIISISKTLLSSSLNKPDAPARLLIRRLGLQFSQYRTDDIELGTDIFVDVILLPSFMIPFWNLKAFHTFFGQGRLLF